MPNTQTIDLRDRVPGGESIDFTDVEVSLDPKTPLVIVRYSENGEPHQYGLRLDLDKSSFLDHFQDVKKEGVLKAAIPDIAEIVERTLYPFEAVGDVLRSQYPAVERDAARPGIWIVPGVHGMAVRAFVPLGIDAGLMSPSHVATRINAFVKTDLFIVLPVSCVWYFVMCGVGWTDDLMSEIEAETQPHFRNDLIKVIAFADLTWFDKRFRVSVIAENDHPGVYCVRFDARGLQARRDNGQAVQRAPRSPSVRIDTNQHPPTALFTDGDVLIRGASEDKYVDEALRRVQGISGSARK